MIAYAEALRRVVEAAAALGPLDSEEVPLPQAAGRVCAAEVRAREAIPPFDNSAMDGYAVAAARTAGARVSAPARLEVVGSVFAGDTPPCATRPGAWEITTGAPLPAGTDAIVRVEDVSKLDGGKSIMLASASEPGDYVRRAGSDFAKGDLACAAGARIDERRVLALAAVGAEKVLVRRRPRVAVLSTGSELAEPGKRPAPGQIRNATGAYLAASLTRLGCEVLDGRSVPDDVDAFERRMNELLAQSPDIIVTTGAVSMGRHDFIAQAVAGLHGDLLFHKTAIKPGKPILAARLPQKALFFGLPGNPVSTTVGLRFFVAPALRALQGLPPEPHARARLSERVEKPEGLRAFLKASLDRDAATAEVRPLEGQGSHQIKPLLDADAWLVVPENPDAVEAGHELDVYPLLPPEY